MTGSSVALDTSVAIAVLNGQGNIGEWIQGFVEVNLPVPVVGDLCYGALNSRNARENLLREGSPLGSQLLRAIGSASQPLAG